jgi:hypothetical protein
LPCNHAHADSRGSALLTSTFKLAEGGGPSLYLDTLPENVFLAFGFQYIYAFDYDPTALSPEIKMQVGCWPRAEAKIMAEYTTTMAYFVISLPSGESHGFEASTISAAVGEVVVAALESVGAEEYGTRSATIDI